MNTVLDLIYRLLAHPTDAMSDVTTGEKMKESSIIWGFVILLLALSSVEAGSFVTAFLASFVGTGSLLCYTVPWWIIFPDFLADGDGKRDYGGVHVCVDPLCFFRFLFSYRTVWPGRHSQICCLCYYCLELFLDILAIRANYGFGKGKPFYQYFSFPSLRHADYCIVCYRYYDGSCRYFGTPECGGYHKFFLRKRGCRQLIGTLNIAWLWYNDLVLHG